MVLFGEIIFLLFEQSKQFNKLSCMIITVHIFPLKIKSSHYFFSFCIDLPSAEIFMAFLI